ncbi:MAG: 6,7-dimethyl-8-ribityllumazine synthase [Opitutales bacterium]|jgi:6,7-dimethyl-8-ribityllumazine synthase|nr:6,7-dimethyl-8-ribityllumazine synthase [Opitutales bacterium]|tara:strand:- start:72 stop:554 length:483 start_codon:yes stop_codon:yes gene_type:complete
MSLDKPTFRSCDASALRLAVVAARYNESLSDRLLSSALDRLREAGVQEDNLVVERVPGSHEVPGGLALLAQRQRFDCLIGLGVVVQGDTSHHKLVGESAAFGLQRLALETGSPAINGIVVVNDQGQAEARVGSDLDRGAEFAEAAVTMGNLRHKWRRKTQ